jgi:hypothetical protein
MLELKVKEKEAWNEKTSEFITIKSQTLSLEHSLVSISKWESTWHKPFLSKDKKTHAELVDYIRCMTLTQNVDPAIYNTLSKEEYERINAYIDDSMTATTFNDFQSNHPSHQGSKITSELIYYWMVSYQIPFECQKWHLNRLLTLIRICSIKNGNSDKKMSKRDALSQQAALNAARRKALGSRG